MSDNEIQTGTVTIQGRGFLVGYNTVTHRIYWVTPVGKDGKTVMDSFNLWPLLRSEIQMDITKRFLD